MRTTPPIRIASAVLLAALAAFLVGVYGRMDELARVAGYGSIAAAAILAGLGVAGRRWGLGAVAALGAIGWILWGFMTAPAEIPLAKAALAVFGSLLAAVIGLFGPGRGR